MDISSSSLADNRTIRLPDDEADAFIPGTDAIFYEPISSARTAMLPIWQSPYLFLPLTSHSNMDSDFAVSLQYF
jgi:hypothetical protein